jgi:hypothetical protein
MPTIELIYDSDCPNVPQARTNLLRAFSQAGMASRWREWDRADADAPAHVRAYGSPTILVDGRDVADATAADAACCRIYTNDQGGKQGVPPIALIVAALAGNAKARKLGRGAIPLLPAVGTALLPKLVCPACWPAYTGILSALGLGFVNYSPFLLPFTALFLVAVVVTLAWRAKTRRGYTPLAMGVVAAVIVLVGKFHFESDPATYAGIALLVGASLWNAWPRRNQTESCPVCVKGGVS